MTAEENFVQVTAHFLGAPCIKFRNSNSEWTLDIHGESKYRAQLTTGPPLDDSRNPKRNAVDSASWNPSKICVGLPNRSLIIVRKNGGQDWHTLDNFTQIFANELHNYGFAHAKKPNVKDVDAVLKSDAHTSILRRARRVKRPNQAYASLSKPTLLITLLPGKDAIPYSEVKWWSDCKAGISTVCVGLDALIKAARRDYGIWGSLW
jgi:hypothetical protein